MKEISWQPPEMVELRAGTLIELEDSPEGRVLAWSTANTFKARRRGPCF